MRSHVDQVHKILQSHGLYEEQLDVIRYRVSTGNVVKFGPGASIEGVYLPPTTSIDVTGIPLHRSCSDVLGSLKEILEDGKRLGEAISISDLRRAPNSPHQTATINVGNRDPKQIMSKLDGAELSGRNISPRLFTASYPNQMEDVSPTERNIVYIYWRAPEMTVFAPFKTSASAIAWCEEHDYSVISGRTIRTKPYRSLMSHFRKVIEIRNLPLDVNQQAVRALLPGSCPSHSTRGTRTMLIERSPDYERTSTPLLAATYEIIEGRVEDAERIVGGPGAVLYVAHGSEHSRLPIPAPIMVPWWSPTVRHPGGTVPVFDLD
jgi:hypothetical protein